MAKHQYEVVVGNIGTVYSGKSSQKFEDYQHRSKSEYGGRAKDESVTMLCDGEITREHIGRQDLMECDCMRCEETFRTVKVEEYCPKCRENMNRGV